MNFHLGSSVMFSLSDLIKKLFLEIIDQNIYQNVDQIIDQDKIKRWIVKRENINSLDQQVFLHSKCTCRLFLVKCTPLGPQECHFSRILDLNLSSYCWKTILPLLSALHSSCPCSKTHRSISVILFRVWAPFETILYKLLQKF